MQKANPKKNLREPQHQPRPGIEKRMKPVPVSDQPEAVSAKLAGKVALITGGDSGIGKASCNIICQGRGRCCDFLSKRTC